MSMSEELRQQTTAVASRGTERTDRVATAELRVVTPPALAATIPLGAELGAERLVLAGRRSRRARPEIGDVSVSRKHLAIGWDAGDGCHIGVDLRSSNGRGDLSMWIDRLRRRWLSERSRAAPAQEWALEARAAEALLLREWRDNLRGVDRLVHALAIAGTAGRSAIRV